MIIHSRLQEQFDQLQERFDHLLERCKPFIQALEQFPNIAQWLTNKVNNLIFEQMNQRNDSQSEHSKKAHKANRGIER